MNAIKYSSIYIEWYRGTAPNLHATLYRCVNKDSPKTSRAFRNPGRTSWTPGLLPPRSYFNCLNDLTPRDKWVNTLIPFKNIPSTTRQCPRSAVFTVQVEYRIPLPESVRGRTTNHFTAQWSMIHIHSHSHKVKKLFASVTPEHHWT